PETGAWTYTLDNNSPGLDAPGLFHGQALVDSFNVRVADEYGPSPSRPYSFAAASTNDPAPTGPVFATGGATNDLLVGTAGDDRLTGAGGTDLLIGLGVADTFDFNNLNEAGDTVSDFSTSQGDKLDVHDLLLSLPGYIPGVTNPSDLLFFNEFPFPGQRPGTALFVDADGIPNGTAIQLAYLEGASGLNANDMIANGSLIV